MFPCKLKLHGSSSTELEMAWAATKSLSILWQGLRVSKLILSERERELLFLLSPFHSCPNLAQRKHRILCASIDCFEEIEFVH